MAGTPLAGHASRGAFRGGLGCRRGRQKEIDDIVSVTGRALGCFVTSPILGGGGPVRAGAALGRRAAWNQTEGKLRSGLPA